MTLILFGLFLVILGGGTSNLFIDSITFSLLLYLYNVINNLVIKKEINFTS